MVQQHQADGETTYRCEECGLHYRDQETAEACESYCRTHQGCSTTLARQAVEVDA